MDICFLFLPFSARGSPSAESGPKSALHYFKSKLRQYLCNTGINAETEVFSYNDEINAETYLDKIYEYLQENYKKYELIIIFGGNHLSVYPVYRFLLNEPGNLIINLDAHRDIYKTDGQLTHASFIRYVEINEESQLINYGYRDFLNCENESLFYSKTFSVFEYKEFMEYLSDMEIDLYRNVYLDIDVDVFDPSIFPYSATNMSMGISLDSTQNLLTYLGLYSPKVISFSEYSPLLDSRNLGISFMYKIAEYLITKRQTRYEQLKR